jgi:hypothetical protein
MVIARIAGLRPGTSPPPVRIPIVPLLAILNLPVVILRALCVVASSLPWGHLNAMASFLDHKKRIPVFLSIACHRKKDRNKVRKCGVS